jgi:hypothetical protein
MWLILGVLGTSIPDEAARLLDVSVWRVVMTKIGSATVLNALGLVSGLLSAICLYLGTLAMPWAIQSWKGETSAEQGFRSQRRGWSAGGFALLALGFALQFAALFSK